jgi:hypothetical protein
LASESIGESAVKKSLSREDEQSAPAVNLDDNQAVNVQDPAGQAVSGITTEVNKKPFIPNAQQTTSTASLVNAAHVADTLAQDSDVIIEEEESAVVIDLLLEKSAEQWHTVFAQIPLRGVVRSVVANCSLEQVVGNTAHFILDEGHASLFNDSYCDRIANAMSELFGLVVSAEVIIGKPSRETPAAYADRLRSERQHNAEQSLHNDENVQNIINEFGGRLVVESIKPLES